MAPNQAVETIVFPCGPQFVFPDSLQSLSMAERVRDGPRLVSGQLRRIVRHRRSEVQAFPAPGPPVEKIAPRAVGAIGEPCRVAALPVDRPAAFQPIARLPIGG